MGRLKRLVYVISWGLLVSSLLQFTAVTPSYSAVPTVTSVVPSSGTADSPTEVTITGENFEPGARVSLLNGGPFLVGRVDIALKKYANRVYVSGAYAYVADRVLDIFDISDPAAPVLVGSYGNLWEIRDVYENGGYAYVTTYSSSLRIIDVRDPASPVYMGTLAFNGYVSDVRAAGEYLYVGFKARTDWYLPLYQAGLGIFDISNPAEPALVSFYETSADVQALQVSGSYVYAVLGAGLGIFDVSDPSDPVLAGMFTDDILISPYTNIYSISAIGVSGDSAYLAGEAGLFIVNVSDPSNPVLAGSIDLPDLEEGEKYRIQVSGKYVFIAARYHGLYVVDAGDPGAPVFAGLYGRRSNDVYVEDGYAYLAAGRTLKVLDVGDPVVPALAGLYFFKYGANGVHASGDYAYMTTSYEFEDFTDYMYRMDMIDITNPASPVKTDEFYEVDCNPAYRSVRNEVFVQGGYAYLAFGPFGLQILDISNPEALTLVGKLYDYEIGEAVSIQVSGDYAYVLVAVRDLFLDTKKRLRVIDVSNPYEPVVVATAGVSKTSSDVYVSGDYAYVADGKTGLRIIDISNPLSPAFAGSYNTPGTAYGVYAYGGYAYVADGKAGLEVIDVSDPSAPVLVGSYNTPHIARGVYVSGSYAYVADDGGRLQVVDVSDPSSPYLADYVITPGPANDVYVSGDYTFVASGNSGIIILNKKAGAVTDVEVEEPGTITATFPAGLPEGPYHILVTNPGGEKGLLHNGFTVLPPADTGKCRGRKGCGRRDGQDGKGHGNQ